MIIRYPFSQLCIQIKLYPSHTFTKWSPSIKYSPLPKYLAKYIATLHLLMLDQSFPFLIADPLQINDNHIRDPLNIIYSIATDIFQMISLTPQRHAGETLETCWALEDPQRHMLEDPQRHARGPPRLGNAVLRHIVAIH